MTPRLDFVKANPAAMKAMSSLEEHISQSGLAKSLAEFVRLRASQIDGCAFCIDVHFSEALKAGEAERRLRQVWIGDKLAPEGQGESRISVEDYAVAMIDELEQPQQIRQRFTVAY